MLCQPIFENILWCFLTCLRPTLFISGKLLELNPVFKKTIFAPSLKKRLHPTPWVFHDELRALSLEKKVVLLWISLHAKHVPCSDLWLCNFPDVR